MSLLVTKTLSFLLYPFNQALLLLMLALVCHAIRRTRTAVVLTALGVAYLVVAAMPPLGNSLMRGLERPYPPVAVDSVPRAEAIVHLGGAMRGLVANGEFGDLNAHADRLLLTAALYRAGKAPAVIVTGGGFEDLPSEASLIADALVQMGIPRSAMQLEERSRDTWDNARYVAELLRDSGRKRVLLVTSAFHMRRSAEAFNAEGVDFFPVPADHQILEDSEVFWISLPSVNALARATLAYHEHAGFWVYRLRRWLEESAATD